MKPIGTLGNWYCLIYAGIIGVGAFILFYNAMIARYTSEHMTWIVSDVIQTISLIFFVVLVIRTSIYNIKNRKKSAQEEKVIW